MSKRKAEIINVMNKIEEFCFKEIDNDTTLTNKQLILKGLEKFINVEKKVQQGSGVVLVKSVQYSVGEQMTLPIFPEDNNDNN